MQCEVEATIVGAALKEIARFFQSAPTATVRTTVGSRLSCNCHVSPQRGRNFRHVWEDELSGLHALHEYNQTLRNLCGCHPAQIYMYVLTAL
jgi:hypothetical protein